MRVALRTHALNTRSREAILRPGAREEGILRSHMVMRDGSLRDTVVHSIVRGEWPRVREALERRLARGG